MERFASLCDIQARFRDLSDAEERRATALIEDATALIIAEGAVIDGSPANRAVLKSIICSMVIRALPEEPERRGVSQYAQTVGAVSESWTLNNPSGDLYLTAQEKRALGIGACHAWRYAGSAND